MNEVVLDIVRGSTISKVVVGFDNLELVIYNILKNNAGVPMYTRNLAHKLSLSMNRIRKVLSNMRKLGTPIVANCNGIYLTDDYNTIKKYSNGLHRRAVGYYKSVNYVSLVLKKTLAGLKQSYILPIKRSHN